MSNVCHARSKQKRRKLRLRNRMQSIHQKRIAKKIKEFEPKGRTFVGIKASEVAIHANELAPKDFGGLYYRGAKYFDHQHKLRLNQRQKRKRARAGNRKLKR